VAQGCDTFKITGYFQNADDCPNTTDTARLSTFVYGIETFEATVCNTVNFACFTPSMIFIEDTLSSKLGFINPYDTIYLQYNLYIDNYFTFTNNVIYTAPGIQIIVMSGFLLTLINTTIEGCNTMWQGITLEPGSQFYSDNLSHIRDANTGVFIDENCQFKIQDSYITDCITGVLIPPVYDCDPHNIAGVIEGTEFGLRRTKLYPDYAGQPAHGLKPKAGVEIHDMPSFTLGSNIAKKNTFKNLNTGFIAHTSYARVYNSIFQSVITDTAYTEVYTGTALIGLGDTTNCIASNTLNVYANLGDTTVLNSQRGVYTDYSNLVVNSINIIYVHTGIESTFCTNNLQTIVSYNNIQATRFGINWYFNAGAKQMRAVENNISVIGASTNAVSINESSSANANYLIDYNHLKVASDGSPSGQITGVNANNVFNPTISCNDLNIVTKHPDPKYVGFLINTCTKSIISNNGIKSHHANQSFYSFGMINNKSDYSNITCNSVDSTNYGIYFGSICLNTAFNGNSMCKHYIPLYLNTTAEIDVQTNAGNKWLDTTKVGAVNMNAANPTTLGKSLFKTNPILGPIYNPSIPLVGTAPPWFVDNLGWFIPSGGNTFNCNNYQGCVAWVADDGGSFELRSAIAKDSTLTVDYIPESKMIAKQSLNEELLSDPVLLASDTVYQNFVTNNQNTSIGLLSDVKTKITNANKLDSVASVTILNLDSLNQISADSIASIEKQYSISHDSLLLDTKQNLINSIKQNNSDKENLLNQKQTDANILLADAASTNQQVTPTLDPDENEKLINEITLLYNANGRNAIKNYYNQILTVAQQCPDKGGRAVFIARIYIALMNDAVVYNDAGICLQQGIYKSSNSVNLDNNYSFDIVPNPANEYVLINLKSNYIGICNIQIKDVLGKIVYSKQFDCKQQQEKINTLNFEQGIYTASIHINDVQLQSAKLSIIR
jgi:hypothetical protein